MISSIIKYLFFFLYFIFPLHTNNINSLSSSINENEWQLKKYENGIAVYTRNTKNSSFKELKSVLTIKTSLKSIVALLNDWDSYPQWVYRCGKSLTLKKISDKEVIHYQTVTAPWPVANRDFVVNIKLVQDEKTKAVTIKSSSKHNYIPEIPNYVRIKEFNASWTLTPLKDGSIEIVYQLMVNPGGSIPAWLVNLAVIDGPFETCSKLKTLVVTEKYQKAVVNYIK